MVTCSASERSITSRRKWTLLMVIVVAALCTGALFVGAESAAATSNWSASSTGDPTETPTPSPTPAATTDKPHEEKVGVQGEERDDLGFLGVVFVGGFGFVLAAGAVGVSLVGRERRRRDRAEAAEKEEGSSDT